MQKCLVKVVLVGMLVVLLSCLAAFADTPGKCNYTDSQCNSTNTCSASGNDTSKCTVGIVRNNLGSQQVSPTINGNQTPMTWFCIQGGATVTWVPADATSFADIRFDGNYPFGQTSFGADSLTSFTHMAQNPSVTSVCYTFAVSDCKFVVQSPSDCANSDPKVIIIDGARLHKKHHRDHDEEHEHQHAPEK